MILKRLHYLGLLVLLVVIVLFWMLSSGRLRQMANANPTFASIARPVYHPLKAAGVAISIEYRTRFKDRRTISEYLNSKQVRKLQLGAGGQDPEDWLSSDIDPNEKEIYLDVMARFPLPDGSFHYVFSEHLIEHVPWEGGIAMLRECYRIMAPGAKMRIVTPNLDRFIGLLRDDSSPEAQQFIKEKLALHLWPSTPVPGAYILNAQLRTWGHQFLYDPATLRKALELASFKQISERPIADKTDPVFPEVESRGRNPGTRAWIVDSWESMAFEVVR